jgi:hypothetical protein
MTCKAGGESGRVHLSKPQGTEEPCQTNRRTKNPWVCQCAQSVRTAGGLLPPDNAGTPKGCCLRPSWPLWPGRMERWLYMSALSYFKLFASGLCAGIFWHEFTRRTGGRRHMPARDHRWIAHQIATHVAHDQARGLWRVRLPNGRVLMSSSKATLELYLDCLEQNGSTP